MFKIRFLKLNVVLVGLFLIFTMMSCSKKSEEVSEVKPENTEAVTVENDNFTESDEDLLKVDYKQFYEELAPHGEWIEVTDDEIGVDLNKTTAAGKKPHRKISFSQLFGVNEAYADDADFGAFFVWKPAPGLAVGVSTYNVSPVVAPVSPSIYVPYSNGQWVNTDQGWYFQAPTPYEEVVHHYGRWAYSPTEGWVWVPGRVWSPAWVDWREDDDIIAWTPLPPGYYLVNGQVIEPPVYEDRYVVVEKRYFVEPEIYKYHYIENKKKVIIHEMRKVNGVMVVDHRVINRGPKVSVIESVLGVPVPVVEINKVNTINAVGYNGTVIHTYSPEFKEFKVVKTINSPVRKPVNYVSYEKIKKNKNSDNSKNDNSNKNRGNDNGNKNIKEKHGKYRLSDDSNMDPRSHKKEQMNTNKSNNKNYKSKGNDQGNKKGNEKYKGNKNNYRNDDKGNKNKGNGNKSNGSRNEVKSKGNKNNGSKNNGNNNTSNNSGKHKGKK